MSNFWGPVATILWKDVLLELRTKDIVVSVLMFALLAIVVFSFAIDPTPTTVALVAPGVLWVAFAFGGVIGLNRSFAVERDRSNIQGIMLAPVGRDTIFFGKMLGNFLFMLAVEVAVYTAELRWTPGLPGGCVFQRWLVEARLLEDLERRYSPSIRGSGRQGSSALPMPDTSSRPKRKRKTSRPRAKRRVLDPGEPGDNRQH